MKKLLLYLIAMHYQILFALAAASTASAQAMETSPEKPERYFGQSHKSFLQQQFGIIPQHNPRHPSYVSVEDDPNPALDFSARAVHGFNTFARLPFVNCFSKELTEEEKYDIAILGAPFDTAVTFRPGARFGPHGIRSASQRMYAEASWNIHTGKNAFLSWAKVVDCGDAPMTYLDNTIALRQLEKAHKLISGHESDYTTASTIPRIIMLGGDHTTTLAALRNTFVRWGQVAVVHFDSHIDTWDPKVLGGQVSDYAGVNHGTFLHIAHEEGLIFNSSIHVGARAPLIQKTGDLVNDARCGFSLIKARELDTLGVKGVVEKIKARVKELPVYISIDIDVLDPAFAPATGTPEPGGWSSRELLTVLDELSGLNIIGGDVVEVAPDYDTAAKVTSLAAAEIVHSLITLMVDKPVRSAKEPKDEK